MSARSQVDKVCRLEDAQGYEFVPMWKSEKGTEECAAEMQPFTSLPVYQPTQTPSAASTMSAPSQGDKVCRVEDAQGYEFAPVWKPEKGTEECGVEMQPFASLPGYLIMSLAQPDAARKVSRSVKDLCGWRIRDTLHGGRRSPQGHD